MISVSTSLRLCRYEISSGLVVLMSGVVSDNWATYFSKLAEYQQALAADKSEETPAPTDHSPTDQNDQPETPSTLP